MGTVVQGKPRGLQEVVAHKMWWTGAEVHVVDTIEGVDALFEWLAVRRQLMEGEDPVADAARVSLCRGCSVRQADQSFACCMTVLR